MPVRDVNRVLCEEIRRVIDEYVAAGRRIDDIQSDRKRLASVAHALRSILAKSAGEPAATRLLERAELAGALARLPALPGRKASASLGTPPPAPDRHVSSSIEPAKETAAPVPIKPKPVATTNPIVLPKGTGIEMLQGKFTGWSGTIRWIKSRGSLANYTVLLTGPSGEKARTQVANRSLGRKWRIVAPALDMASRPAAVVPDPVPASEPPRAPLPPRPRTTRPRPEGGETPRVLPRGTEVRVLVGKYANLTGTIGYTTVKGSIVTYTVYVTDANGRRNRTQVNHGTLGKTWDLIGERAEPAPAVAPSKVIRRRPAADRAPRETGTAAVPEESLPPGVLRTRTPVRMIAGHHLGYTGVVTSVHARPGPGAEAIYTLSLTGPDGKRVRTTVKQGSLGRMWVKVG